MTTFGIDPLDYLVGSESDRAVESVVAYMSDCTGAWFNRLADPDPKRITTADLYAVTTLSVEVPPAAGIWLMQSAQAEPITALLTDIPETPIQDLPAEELADGSPADRLWTLLRSANGVGPVTAGKLLAAKRPASIPIYDQSVARALAPPPSRFWQAMHGRFQDSVFVSAVTEIRDRAMSACQARRIEVPCDPTLLRTLDIVCWMRVHGFSRVRDPQVRAFGAIPLGA